MKPYTLTIGGLNYMVDGPGDLMSSPPSARGFSLKLFERGSGKYAVVYKATEENGYGFLIYADVENKLILKGGLGSDHKETIYSKSDKLQLIRREKYSNLNDMEFLRKTCLSGRTWVVDLKNKKHYFVAIWNVSITREQNNLLNDYLLKFPKNDTYIQMGMYGSGPQSEFQPLSGFKPKITSSLDKITTKQKKYVLTPHVISPMLPKSYSDELKRLSMTENHYKFADIARKIIPKLERTKVFGKLKTPITDIVTKSYLSSVLIGLGNHYPNLSSQLENLEKYSFSSVDLSKLHNRGKLDLTNWTDVQLQENELIDKKLQIEIETSYRLNEGWKDWVAAGALGLSTLGGGELQAGNPIKVSTQLKRYTPSDSGPSTNTSNISFDQSFIDYIKSVENAGKVGYNKQKKLWFPHKSFEGGSDTIGYGHKIQPGENFKDGITDRQADELLKKDLEKAKNQVYKELGGKQLSKKQLEMFVDFVFNMGTLKKFPKFTQAALKGDVSSMRSNYKRFSGSRELKGRNQSFLNRFLTEYFGFNYYF